MSFLKKMVMRNGLRSFASKFPSSIESLGVKSGFPGHVIGTTSSAEFVGLTAEEAVIKIKEEMGGVQIQVVPQGAVVTMDYQPDRVRIFVDSSGKVTWPPKFG